MGSRKEILLKQLILIAGTLHDAFPIMPSKPSERLFLERATEITRTDQCGKFVKETNPATGEKFDGPLCC